MRNLVLKIRENIFESPGWKTFFSSVIPIFSGLFSGIFVFEITTVKGINWKTFYKAKSFYCLLLVILIVYIYNRALFLYEKKTLRFLDNDYCIAYMRSKCLPEAAEKYKELIRHGKGGELKQAMDEMKKILK